MNFDDLIHSEHVDNPDYQVSLVCDECGQLFECPMDQALADLAFKEDQGVPIVCAVCQPQTPYEEDV